MVENFPSREEIDFRKKMFQHGSYKLKKGRSINNDGNSSENITYPKSEFVIV